MHHKKVTAQAVAFLFSLYVAVWCFASLRIHFGRTRTIEDNMHHCWGCRVSG
ncbi:hypothetical protein ARMA_1493 [Ardenticatena maritima]|uniref:Uncharacterized protein n=1 Tax=Ardenticatena maritima TaxID=872965 RepID=A0A0M9UCP6_9CHLR|nr:hypothetical protein ARMA_1493 [Ardenticatena maritima]